VGENESEVRINPWGMEPGLLSLEPTTALWWFIMGLRVRGERTVDKAFRKKSSGNDVVKGLVRRTERMGKEKKFSNSGHFLSGENDRITSRAERAGRESILNHYKRNHRGDCGEKEPVPGDSF